MAVSRTQTNGHPRGRGRQRPHGAEAQPAGQSAGDSAPSHPVHLVLRPGRRASVTSEEQGAACQPRAQGLLSYRSLS